MSAQEEHEFIPKTETAMPEQKIVKDKTLIRPVIQQVEIDQSKFVSVTQFDGFKSIIYKQVSKITEEISEK